MMSSTSVELELATKTPLPGSVSVLSVYSETQPEIVGEQIDFGIELEEITHGDQTENEGPSGRSTSMHSSFNGSVLNVSSLPPVDKGRKAWQFLTAAFVVEAVTWGFVNSFGTFLNAYLQNKSYASQPHAISLLPLIGTLSSGIIYCSGPFIYPYINRYPEHRRWLIRVGVVLCWASLFFASFSTKIEELLVLEGVLYAIGGSLSFAPCMSFMSEWFVQRRGMAGGIMFAGTAVGGSIFPLILPHLINRFGILVTLRIFSFILLGLMLPILPFLRPRLPESRVHGPAPSALSDGADRSWAKEPTFLLAVLANTFQGFAYFIPLIWLPTFASELELSASDASLTLALLNGFSVISRIGMGFLTDKFNTWLLSIMISGAASFATFVFWGVLSRTYGGLLAFGIVYGTVASGWSSLFAGFAKPHAKDNPPLLTSLLGLFMFTRGLGNILSTPISTALSKPASSTGQVHNPHPALGFLVADGRYERLIWYSGSCFAAASVIAMVGWGIEGAKGRKNDNLNRNRR